LDLDVATCDCNVWAWFHWLIMLWMANKPIRSCQPKPLDPSTSVGPTSAAGPNWYARHVEGSLRGISLRPTVPKVDVKMKRMLWRGLTAAITAASVVTTRRALTTAWRSIAGEPPAGAADRKASWGSAVTWAAAAGVGAAVARLMAVRLSAQVWEAVTHEAPPELVEL
jgi:hypothetical protein